MTRNLETADKITKLTLAVATVILYFLHLIEGPFAKALLILSVGVITISIIKVMIHRLDES
jgi:hypothetical protein